jgi:hypothetical protein
MYLDPYYWVLLFASETVHSEYVANIEECQS